MLKRRIVLQGAGAVLSMAGAASWPQSQAPVRILVGAPAGGTTDAMARILAPSLSQSLGRTVIVENKPGAGGNLAAEAVARAAPDGQTLLMSFTSHAINASLYPSLPFDPLRDFTPLSMVATSPSMLVAHPGLPVANVAELIALAKRQPGRLNFAVGAMGSSLQLAGDAFKMQAGVQITNIPYRGTAPALQDVLAGQVELMFAAVGNVQAHVRSGKLKALAVTTRKRLPAFAEVPSLAETLPGYESSAWFGLFGPARLPASTTQRLADAVRAALQTQEVRQRIEGEGAQPGSSNPEEFARFVQSEIARWREVVVFSGAKPE
ncbi:MAG: tripartite tricarboxylate transporter substrate binding protein [Limnohabitans sp.]|nr:tripartite tricarboxylate transporter substrate binding protein [Limnohabitans sp.]